MGQEKGNDDNNKERISIRSDGGDSLSEQRSRLNASKVRKVSAVSIFNLLYFNLICRKTKGQSLRGGLIIIC